MEFIQLEIIILISKKLESPENDSSITVIPGYNLYCNNWVGGIVFLKCFMLEIKEK